MRDIEAINKRLACKADCEGCSDYQNCEESFDNFCDDVLAYTSLLEGISLDRLETICAAEKDGRLLILPACGACENFTGAGDWDLCCRASEKRLCYKNTDATGCKSYKPRAEAEKALVKEQG